MQGPSGSLLLNNIFLLEKSVLKEKNPEQANDVPKIYALF
jgi:hypothetical protein